jgi:hypothetical protein
LELDHPLGLIDAHELDAELPKNPLPELAFAASDLEHPPGLRLRDGLEQDLARVRPLRRRVGRLSRAQVRLVCVLRPDVVAIVEAQRY